MHAYLCAKKCKKAIEDKEFVDEDKIAETLSHIRLHLEPEPFIQTQHVINAHVIWTILDNLYHAIGFSAEFLLCKDLFSIILIKCGNNVETNSSKMKKCIDDLHVKNCNILLIFSTSLILMGLSGKYESIVAVAINHIRLKRRDVFKINSNIDWLYYFILNEARRIDAQSIQNIPMAMTSSSANSGNFKNKFKKNKKKDKKISNKSANKFCELHKMNAIHIDKNCFHHNEIHSASEYKITVIADEHALFSAISVDWILDSGIIKHVCCNKAYFDHLKSYNISLKWDSASQININDIDSIRFFLFDNSSSDLFLIIWLKNVLFVFELNINLLFWINFKKIDMKSIFNLNYIKLEKTSSLSMTFIDKIWLISTLNLKQKKHSFWSILISDMLGWSI